MPTSPFVTVQMSVNSGAPVQGGQTVAGASTIQLSLTNTSLLTSVRWEIYAYPSGWPTPSGWTLDASTGIIYSTDTTPTLITLEAASTRWGKWLVRCIGNNGTKNGVPPTTDPITGSYLPNDVIDIASGWQVLSPNHSLVEPALFEGTQFGGLRRWQAAIAAALRIIDGITGGGGSGVTWQVGTDAAYQVPTARGRQIVIIPTLTANRTYAFPQSPQDGDEVEFDDRTGVIATSGFVLSVKGFAGTEHVQAAGADQGTLYAIPSALLGDGSVVFTYRATSTTWEMA